MSNNIFQKLVSSVGSAMSKFIAIAKFEKITDNADPDAPIKCINNMKRIAVMIGLLILVLVIVILSLRGCQGGEPPHGSVDIPGNVIDPIPPVVTPKADLEFNNTNAEENLSFDVDGMNGGDSKSTLYRIIAKYNSDFILKYDMTIREDEEFQKLAEIMKIKVELVVTDGDSLLYDGLLSDMSAAEINLSANAKTQTEYLFRITIYLDAPLGEQYYGQKLIADMSWWIEEQDNISIANNEFTTVSKTTPPDPPTITPDLKFVTINEGDNTAFDMKNIKDGDSQARYFAFEVTHGEDVKMAITNAIVTDSKLHEVLKVKVELVGENGNTILYEGLLKDLNVEHTLTKNDNNKTAVYYKVTVIADGLTEDYCETKLVCDLSWTLDGTSEQLKVPSNSFVAYDKPVTPPSPPNPPTPPQPPETATSIKLTAKDRYDNVPFDVENMLPGDSKAQYYCVSVTHDSTESVRFYINLDTTQKLSNVLRVKIEQLIPDDFDKVLYDGLMKDCTAVDVNVTASSETVTPIYYRITVYTNGAEVGNEYAGESLTADFSWQLQ
jgi:hypothetical protein